MKWLIQGPTVNAYYKIDDITEAEWIILRETLTNQYFDEGTILYHWKAEGVGDYMFGDDSWKGDMLGCSEDDLHPNTWAGFIEYDDGEGSKETYLVIHKNILDEYLPDVLKYRDGSDLELKRSTPEFWALLERLVK